MVGIAHAIGRLCAIRGNRYLYCCLCFGVGYQRIWWTLLHANGCRACHIASACRKKVNKGLIATLIAVGFAMATVTYFLLSYAGAMVETVRGAVFLAIGLMQGLTYGLLHPSFNTLFVRLAPESHRGAATSMFLTSNDLGIGVGMLIGSMVAAYYGGFYAMYRLGDWLSLLALLFFIGKTKSHYLRHRID